MILGDFWNRSESEYGLKALDMDWNYWKQIAITGNGLKLLEMDWNYWKWILITDQAEEASAEILQSEERELAEKHQLFLA